MKQKQIIDKKGEHSTGQTLRQYVAPRVLSSEDLEAMAVSCDPDGLGGTGKSSDQGCGTPPIKLGT